MDNIMEKYTLILLLYGMQIIVCSQFKYIGNIKKHINTNTNKIIFQDNI